MFANNAEPVSKPFGIRYLSAADLVSFVCFVVAFIFVLVTVVLTQILAAFQIVSALKWHQKYEKVDPIFKDYLSSAAINILIWIFPVILWFLVLKALDRRAPSAFFLQALASFLFFFSFPLGTLFHGAALLILFFDPATRRYFLIHDSFPS